MGIAMNRTSTEQEPDNRTDNPLQPAPRFSKEKRALASWRSGYAADCKSRCFSTENKAQAENRYQDRPGTVGEHDNRHSRPKTRPFLARLIHADHKRMSRVLGYALTLGTADAWADLATVAVVRLAERERFGLAWAALRALPKALAEDVAREVLGGAGVPLPPFLGGMADARFWASRATPAERKACALAAYEAMSPSDQAAFFRHISELEVAA